MSQMESQGRTVYPPPITTLLTPHPPLPANRPIPTQEGERRRRRDVISSPSAPPTHGKCSSLQHIHGARGRRFLPDVSSGGHLVGAHRGENQRKESDMSAVRPSALCYNITNESCQLQFILVFFLYRTNISIDFYY